MPTWVKVVLIIVIVVGVLGIAAVVAGLLVARRYGPELIQENKQAMDEGQEYGRRTDDVGCLNEAVARQARVTGFRDMLKNNFFTRSCLEVARPTPGFCEGVPRRLEFMKGVAWQAQQCKRYGLGPETQCSQFFQQIQQFCEERDRTPRPTPNTNGGAATPETTPAVKPPPAPKPAARPR
jgi:hypothetical protein